MIAPGEWAVASLALPSPLILCDSCFRVRQARKPPRVHARDVVGQHFSCLRWRTGIGLRLLMGQLTQMHDDKAQGLLGNTPIAVFDLPLAEHAWPCQRRGASAWVRPGFSTNRGKADC